MSSIEIGPSSILNSLSKRSFWGPFLVLAGIALLYFRRLLGDSLIPSSFLIFSGVAMMFRQLGGGMVTSDEGAGPSSSGDADYVVKQLSRNFEILRAQTNQGFILSGVFMSIGLLLIAFSLLAPTLGLKGNGVETLGVASGIITEFISGTALLLYRVNFGRLNQTSDKLDDAWRVLTAFNLTHELPDAKKADATMVLIQALISRPGAKSEPQSPPDVNR
jgi:hypothetical protein